VTMLEVRGMEPNKQKETLQYCFIRVLASVAGVLSHGNEDDIESEDRFCSKASANPRMAVQANVFRSTRNGSEDFRSN